MVERVAEAIRGIEAEKYGMVIIGVHFDDSQMFELLHHVRMDSKERAVPVVCLLGERNSQLSAVTVEGLDHAVKAMMANAFLDLRRFSDDAAGNGRIRRIVDYLILIDGDLHQGLEQVP